MTPSDNKKSNEPTFKEALLQEDQINKKKGRKDLITNLQKHDIAKKTDEIKRFLKSMNIIEQTVLTFDDIRVDSNGKFILTTVLQNSVLNSNSPRHVYETK